MNTPLPKGYALNDFKHVGHGLWGKTIKRGFHMVYRPLFKRCGTPRIRRLYNLQYLATYTSKREMQKDLFWLEFTNPEK